MGSALFNSGLYMSLSSACFRIEDIMIFDEGYLVAV